MRYIHEKEQSEAILEPIHEKDLTFATLPTLQPGQSSLQFPEEFGNLEMASFNSRIPIEIPNSNFRITQAQEDRP